MNPDEYAALQAAISRQAAADTLQFSSLFRNAALAPADWLQLLKLLFPRIADLRYQSAQLGRRFYDAQRAEAHPELPENKQYLETYDFPRFVRDMEPSRKKLSAPNAPPEAAGQVALHSTRAVENAGRQQIIHAVEDDSRLEQKIADAPEQSGLIRGWARVATGRETCEWCLMLVSRGPVYRGADSAGLNLDDKSAVKAYYAGDDVSKYSQRWHTGCDCKVVPVFKRSGWAGEKASKRALALWNDAMEEAITIEKSKEGPGQHYRGEDKGKTFTRNQLALNALRRKLSSGEIKPAEYAGIAA